MESAPTAAERRVAQITWAVLGASVVLIIGLFLTQGPSKIRQAKGPPLPRIAQVPPFQLTNQLGKPIGLDAFSGKVWVANLIFSRCPGPCTQMTRAMTEIRDRAGDPSQVAWLSLTADPEFDSPEVLLSYAKKWGADAPDWQFVTGLKSQVRSTAIHGLKMVLVDKEAYQRESEEDLFLHSTRFILVDRAGWIRGVYEGTEKPAREALVQDIQKLVAER